MNTIKIIDIEKFTNLQACNNKLQKISIAISTSKKSYKLRYISKS